MAEVKFVKLVERARLRPGYDIACVALVILTVLGGFVLAVVKINHALDVPSPPPAPTFTYTECTQILSDLLAGPRPGDGINKVGYFDATGDDINAPGYKTTHMTPADFRKKMGYRDVGEKR